MLPEKYRLREMDFAPDCVVIIGFPSRKDFESWSKLMNNFEGDFSYEVVYSDGHEHERGISGRDSSSEKHDTAEA